MKKTIFDYLDYKLYINETIQQSPAHGRGMKLQIAKYLQCQTAFVSQVLNGEPNFSLEHGVRLNQYFGHNKEESRFFLLLLQFYRAGSGELQKFFKEQVNEILSTRSDLKNRIDIKTSLKKLDQQIYYSSWVYSAIHMMVAIPQLQTLPAITQTLNLPREKVLEVLTFLEETGLVKQKNGKYEIGVTRIHLGRESAQIQRHHTNWRMQAIRSIDLNNSEDLHFSTVVSMSIDDVAPVKEILIKAIEDCRKIIRDSKEEKVQSICIDFFGI